MSSRKNTGGPPVAMTPEQIAEYKRQALERYEQQQKKNESSTSGRTSPQRGVSPRKSSRTAVSLTPEQIAEYKKQAQEYYTQTMSGDPASPPSISALSPRKISIPEPVNMGAIATSLSGRAPAGTDATQPNWSRKKSVLTPIPPAELLAAMAAQGSAGDIPAPRPASSRTQPPAERTHTSPQRPASDRKDAEPLVSPRSRGGLSNLTPEQIAEIKAKAQADYERQQRENEEIRLKMAAGQMGSGRKATEARIQMDPEQAAEYKRKMQEEYERQQRENEEIRKQKEEEAKAEAAVRANMNPDQVVEYKRKMQEDYERQQRENEEIRRRKEQEGERALSPQRSNMSAEEVAEYKRQALIKYEQQRRENERARKLKEEEAKQAMAGTFTRQSMAPVRRQQHQAGGPVQLVDDLVDDAPPVSMARTSPQRGGGLSYIEIPPIKAERRIPTEPVLSLEEQERLRPVQVSPRLAGGANPKSNRLKTVLVTGATGFIGSHVVKTLMMAGYRVKGLVRRLNSRSSGLLQSLRDLAPGAAHPLQLVDGDLTIKGSIDEHLQGVDLVVHCAGVMNFAPPDPFADMLKPVVLGTLGLLTSCKAAKTVERVVVLSAAAAVHDVPDSNKIYDESYWNEVAKLDTNCYAFAKVEQESNVNKFLNQLPEAERFDVVILNPTTVIGPLLTRELRSTAEIVYHLMAGNLPMVPNWGTGVVDVRDVARAVLSSLEKPHAQGRYILNSRSMWLVDIAKELGSLFPSYNIGTMVAPTIVTLALPLLDSKMSFNYLWANLGSIAYYDTGRSKGELAMTYTPFEDTLHDAGESLIQFGLLANKTGSGEAPAAASMSYMSYTPPEEEGLFSRMSKMFW